MPDDRELLLQFVENQSQQAFRDLVQRHVDVVYSAALRQVRGDVHLAWDVTQGVFLAMAQKAPELCRHPVVLGWLYTTTRNLATSALRSMRRRSAREEVASQIQEANTPGQADFSWEPVWPVIDEAMHELGETDRNAILLRYFNNKPLAEVGQACGVTENAARMRVERAIDKIRTKLAKRGITSTAAALGAALATRSVAAAPTGLVQASSNLAFAGSSALAYAGGTWFASTLFFMSTTKVALALVTGLAVGACAGAYFARGYSPTTNDRSGAPASASPQPEAAQILSSTKARPVATNPASHETPPTFTTGVNPVAEKLNRLRTLADVRRQKLGNPSITVASRDGKLTPAFCQLFNVQPHEQAILENALQSAIDQLSSLERKNAVVKRGADNFTISVNAYPTEGGQILDRALNTIKQTLGSERYDAFVTLSVDQLERSLGHFGTVDRTVTLTRKESNDGYSYEMREHEKSPTSNSTRDMDYKTIEDARRALGRLAPLLPADYR